MKLFKSIQNAYQCLESWYLEMLNRSRNWGRERKPVPFYGRLPGEPMPVIEVWRKNRMETIDLMIWVIILGAIALVFLAFPPNWTVLYR